MRTKYTYPKKPTKPIIRRLPWLLGVLAIVVLGVGILASGYDLQNNVRTTNQTKKAIAQANKGIDNGTPATTPISTKTFANYHVAANFPRYILISKIHVKALVLSLGITAANQIKTPPNVYEAGWYKNSSLPGKPGAMLIDGHVSSWTTNGIFYDLKTLVSGDTIQIERGDGTMFTYKVVKSQVYSSANVDMTAALSPVNPNKPGLNLITCSGKVTAGTNDFNKRVVVFTEQM